MKVSKLRQIRLHITHGDKRPQNTPALTYQTGSQPILSTCASYVPEGAKESCSNFSLRNE